MHSLFFSFSVSRKIKTDFVWIQKFLTRLVWDSFNEDTVVLYQEKNVHAFLKRFHETRENLFTVAAY